MKNAPMIRKPKLATAQINMCMLHMVRNADIFDYAQQHLKPTHFGYGADARCALVWEAVLAVAARNGGTLPEQGLELAIATELISITDKALEIGEVNAQVVNDAHQMLVWIFDSRAENLSPDYHKSMVQDLVIERVIISEISREMAIANEVGRPQDIATSLSNYSDKLQRLLIDHKQAGQTAFPDNFKPKKMGKFSTGIPWLDVFMNGGQAPGEVYVMLGPTGLGKTTVGVMLVVESARIWNKAFIEGTIPRPKVNCFFSWEQDLDRMRLRFWSYAATIDSNRLEAFTDERGQLSNGGQYETYELEELGAEIEGLEKKGQHRGEKERLDIAMAEFRDTTQIFDFSGAAENPHLGEGGLDEVAATLKMITEQGKDIGIVVLDYAGASIRRSLAAKGLDYSDMRHHLAEYCNAARIKIANQFGCPVWVLHQLNPESNRKSPTAKQHHSFASECGNFAENAWFAFVFSTKDQANKLCRLFCTKSRRSSGDAEPVILKIEGNFGRMKDVSDKFVAGENGTYTTKRNADSYIPSDQIKDAKDAKAEQEKKRPGSSGMGNY